MSWPLLREYLQRPLTSYELDEVAQICQKIGAQIANLEKSTIPLNLTALHLARQRASNTLKFKPDQIVHWEKALLDWQRSLETDQPLSLAMLERWNRLLLPDRPDELYRQIDNYIREKKLLGPADIPQAMQDFESDVLNRKEDPLLVASRIDQWLITIHPFPNGNGRTTRLATDYWLMQNGYPPMVLPSAQEAYGIISPSHPVASSPMSAFRQVARAVERSIEILRLPMLVQEPRPEAAQATSNAPEFFSNAQS